MSRLAVPKRRPPTHRWVDQTTRTPAGRLVASAPLAEPVYAVLAATRPDLHEALATNPWLTPEAFMTLYRAQLPAPVALTLLTWRLTPEEIDHVLFACGERRSEILTALAVSQELSTVQAAAVTDRVRAQVHVADLLHLDGLAPTHKVALLSRVGAADALVFVANVALAVPDDQVWSLARRAVLDQGLPEVVVDLDGDPHSPPATVSAALGRLVRARPGLVDAALDAGGFALAGVAAAFATTPAVRTRLAATLDGDAVPGPWRDSVVALHRARDAAAALAPEALVACLDEAPASCARAWRAVELAADPDVDPDVLGAALAAHADAIATWCGPEPVTNAAMLCAIRAGRLDADPVTVTRPGRDDRTGRQAFTTRAPAPAQERAHPPGPPEPRQAYQVLASPVGGGDAWGVNPVAVGAVISDALGADLLAWEVLLGLSETFLGTVGEMLAVARATASPTTATP